MLRKIRLCRGCTAAHRTARCEPSLPATIEHGHVFVPDPVQHPPSAAAVIASISVVHNDLALRADTHGAHPRSKFFARGQWMAATAGFVSRLALVAQIMIQIDVSSTCEMPRFKRLTPRMGLHQIETAIPQDGGCGAGLQGLELGN